MFGEKKGDVIGPFETPKDLMMFFQTTFRNSALTTAVSFAALGYSRFYRGKNKLYSSGLVVISLLLLSVSTYNNYMLYKYVQDYKNVKEYTDIKDWEPINYMFFVIHTTLLFFALWTLLRMLTETTF